MPEVRARRRTAKRSGSARFRLNRWYYRHRPQVAVAVAFLAASVIGLGVVVYRDLQAPAPPPDLEASDTEYPS